MSTYGDDSLFEIIAAVNEALNITADAVWSEVGIRDEGCND